MQYVWKVNDFFYLIQTFSTMLYNHLHEGVEAIPVNDFGDLYDLLKIIREQPIPNPEKVHDPNYI